MAYPQISVIVPVYNSSEYLAQCLDTISNQTYRDIEIICVNDGSTDGSLGIIKEFAAGDNRFIVVDLDSSSGSAAFPRNIGLEIARGKYVIFLDSDDYFDLTLLEKLHVRSEETIADLVLCDSYTLSLDTGEMSAKNTELHYKYLPELETFSYKDIPNTIFQISNAAVWHKLILRETLVRYDLKFQLYTPILDNVYFVNLLLVLSERISVIRDRLIFYRLNRDGAQTTRIEKHKDSILLAFTELNKYLIKHSLYEAVKFSLQNWTLTMMAWWMHSVGNYDAFCELHDLYREEYFEKLGLMGIDPAALYNGLDRFYNSILGRDLQPTLKVIIESVLPAGSKVAIYGAGLVGKKVYKVVNTQCKHDIVIWCDINAEKLAEKLKNPLIKHPKELASCSFDAVIIAMDDCEITSEIKAYLAEMGIDACKIFSVRNF